MLLTGKSLDGCDSVRVVGSRGARVIAGTVCRQLVAKAFCDIVTR
jgi:hypothetical protein